MQASLGSKTRTERTQPGGILFWKAAKIDRSRGISSLGTVPNTVPSDASSLTQDLRVISSCYVLRLRRGLSQRKPVNAA